MTALAVMDLGDRSHGLPRSTTPLNIPPRRIVYRTRGEVHGPITRLMSPSDDVAELLKPFVFLDRVDVDSSAAPRFGWHPHSGIATLTLLLEGGFAYEDSTGATGTMRQGAVEWMQAGDGVWHTGHGIGRRITGYQLWVTLPPALENGAAHSRYLSQDSFPTDGPARLILGNFGAARSPIPSPSPMTYLDVRLAAGEIWHYKPPKDHNVAWIAMHQGTVWGEQAISAGELVVFEETHASITLLSEVDSRFVLGSAAKHPHDLVTGYYSVHTSEEALGRGEANIQRIGADLRRAGKL